MDPNATLKLIRDAFDAQDWTAVEELTFALLLWLDRGGFPPTEWRHNRRRAYQDIYRQYRRPA
jgi:hypothetical protein